VSTIDHHAGIASNQNLGGIRGQENSRLGSDGEGKRTGMCICSIAAPSGQGGREAEI
jgi:hypothetical protein